MTDKRVWIDMRWMLLVAGIIVSGCASAPPAAGGDSEGSTADPSTPAKSTAAKEAGDQKKDLPLVAMLPRPAGQFAPSETLVTGDPLDGSTLADVNECDGCHAETVMQWRTSAHAFASFSNPIYRAVVDRFRDEAGKDKSRFCGGCHDVGLLVDGAMDKDISPLDLRAHGGITCRTCHSIVEAKVDGNGSYTLTGAPIPIPISGDAESIAIHVARVKPLRTAQMCATCHRAFLGETTGNAHHLIGQDDATPWERSAYAGSNLHLLDEPVAQQECRHCHMPREPVTLNEVASKQGQSASHRFLGSHTWLAAMRGDMDSQKRVEQFLAGSVSIDIAAVIHDSGERSLPADGADIKPGEHVVFDVVVRNQRVGHRFPGGVMDAQDAWIEIAVYDSQGRMLAEAGTEHERSGADPAAHRFASLAVGDDGRPLLERQTHRFRGSAYNHTILPRHAAVVEYGFQVPQDLAQPAYPLRVTAKLRHRTRHLDLQKLSCVASTNPRGKAFRALRPMSDVDACTPQPITNIAETEVWIGQGWQSRDQGQSRPPTWKRLYEHGYGLLHALQERRGEARPSLEQALKQLGTTGNQQPRAMVLAALAMLSARQGRVDESLSLLDQAAVLAPDHPALLAIRGEALTAVWRFQEALAPLAQAAKAVPNDSAIWVDLAIARGSVGDAIGALEAAQQGLLLQPRDQDLLRVQALSLKTLSAPQEEVNLAEHAYLDHRPADVIPRVKALCSKLVAGCANERNPVHLHEMRSVANKE